MERTNGREDNSTPSVQNTSTLPLIQYSAQADSLIGYIYFFICFVGTVFNFMMLIVIVMKFLKRKFNPTSIIMLQLCVIDLIGCSTQAPVVSYALVKGRKFDIADENTFTVFCDIFGYLSTLLPLLSIYLTSNLCFIRFIGVYYVFSSKRIMTINKAIVLSSVSWLIPILVAALPFYGGNHFVYESSIGAFYMLIDFTQYTYPRVIKLCANLSITIPFVVTVVCCVMVVLKLKKNMTEQEELQKSSVTNCSENRTATSDRLREYSRSNSTSNSRLSASRDKLSRENSQVPDRDQNSRESKSSLNLLRENSGKWLRKMSVMSGVRSPKRSDDSNCHRASSLRQLSHLSDTDSSRRASITITIITAAFIISYGPYMILWIYSLVAFELELIDPLLQPGSRHWHIYLYIYLVSTTLLSTFNSSIFPLIYFVRIRSSAISRFWDSARGRWARIVEKSDNSCHRYIQLELQQDRCNGMKHNNNTV